MLRQKIGRCKNQLFLERGKKIYQKRQAVYDFRGAPQFLFIQNALIEVGGVLGVLEFGDCMDIIIKIDLPKVGIVYVFDVLIIKMAFGVFECNFVRCWNQQIVAVNILDVDVDKAIIPSDDFAVLRD